MPDEAQREEIEAQLRILRQGETATTHDGFLDLMHSLGFRWRCPDYLPEEWA